MLKILDDAGDVQKQFARELQTPVLLFAVLQKRQTLCCGRLQFPQETSSYSTFKDPQILTAWRWGSPAAIPQFYRTHNVKRLQGGSTTTTGKAN